MTFDEWWDQTQPEAKEVIDREIAQLKAYARMGWNASPKNQW